jgi:hypothetical protein
MSDERRDGEERRRVQRGGRRASDLLSLSPELQREAAGYAAEIERCLEVLDAALADGDLVSARLASQTLKRAADQLHALLTTGKSMSAT